MDETVPAITRLTRHAPRTWWQAARGVAGRAGARAESSGDPAHVEVLAINMEGDGATDLAQLDEEAEIIAEIDQGGALVRELELDLANPAGVLAAACGVFVPDP